jgi:nitroreductase
VNTAEPSGTLDGDPIMSVQEVLSLIRNRRSVRDFGDRPVPKELVDQIVECGLSAPSSKNSNPWFIVTASGEDKARVVEWFEEAATSSVGLTGRAPIDPLTGVAKEGIADTVTESIAVIAQCDTLVLLFNRAPFSRGSETILTLVEDPKKRSTSSKALYCYAGEIIGIGAAAENMLLAAKALGLGAVYMADSYPVRQRIMEALRTTRELIGVIALGYPTHDAPPRELRREFAAAWPDAVGRIDLSVSEQESFWVNEG